VRRPAGKLKTYQTSLGFFDLAIAAPSMKAALEVWGADSNLFHQDAAKESHDPDVIAATMAKPGVVLRRPVGSETALSTSVPSCPPIWATAKDRRKLLASLRAKKPASRVPVGKLIQLAGDRIARCFCLMREACSLVWSVLVIWKSAGRAQSRSDGISPSMAVAGTFKAPAGSEQAGASSQASYFLTGDQVVVELSYL
jgi:hypothetical protein